MNAYSAIWNQTFSRLYSTKFASMPPAGAGMKLSPTRSQPVGLPTDNIDQIGSLGQGGNNAVNRFGASIGSIFNQWTYGYKDVATKIVGRHTIKFGGELTRLYYLNQCAGCGVPGYRFFNIWDFLNDAPHLETGSFNPSTGFPTTHSAGRSPTHLGIYLCRMT